MELWSDVPEEMSWIRGLCFVVMDSNGLLEILGVLHHPVCKHRNILFCLDNQTDKRKADPENRDRECMAIHATDYRLQRQGRFETRQTAMITISLLKGSASSGDRHQTL